MAITGLNALVDACAKDELSDGDRKRTMVNGRHRLYKCPAGKWTIGYGRNLEDNGISDSEARTLLMNDVLAAQRDAASLIPNWLALDVVRQNVCANMAFNMGRATLSKFVHFLAAVDEMRYEDAADEMKASKWYGQVGQRAQRLEHEMRTGIVL